MQPMNDQPEFKPLPLPIGQFSAREKKLWKDITSTLEPGHISLAEIPLMTRLIKAIARVEAMESEYRDIFEQKQSCLALGGNQNVTVHPILAGIDKTNVVIANLYQKMRMCASSRQETTAAVTRGGSVRNPTKLRDPEDLLFGDAAPATKAEQARWKREGKLQ